MARVLGEGLSSLQRKKKESSGILVVSGQFSSGWLHSPQAAQRLSSSSRVRKCLLSGRSPLSRTKNSSPSRCVCCASAASERNRILDVIFLHGIAVASLRNIDNSKEPKKLV